MEEFTGTQKSHKVSKSGRKADKKKAKKNLHEVDYENKKQRNPKAFAIQNVGKTERRVRRKEDITEKRKHVPSVDRTPVEPPPYVVAIVGPPKVGKSTLLKCLVRNFTRQNLNNIRGPITIVSGKKRRLTLIEVCNDINAMIDAAKIADLVLLLVDASFGFEMEVFEFLNICQVHGFPRIMGVLTHLDTFKSAKILRRTKKIMKHRFWTEVYEGAKLFYLSGTIHGEYQKTEIHNLGRFISIIKFRPMIWRESHSYILADRLEDLTDPELLRSNSKTDRHISLYGYLRGTNLKAQSNVHIPGVGDFPLSDVSFLPDPCPLPETVSASSGKRTLNEKDKCSYGPMSGIGGLVYDKDAVYIDIGGTNNSTKRIEENTPSNDFVASIMNSEQTLDEKMEESRVQLFSNFPSISFSELHDENDRHRRKVVFENEIHDNKDEESDDNDEDSKMDCDENEDDDQENEDEEEESEDDEIGSEDEDKNMDVDSETEKEESGLQWKVDIAKKASESFYARQSGTLSLKQLVYGTHDQSLRENLEEDQEDEIGGLFKVMRKNATEKSEHAHLMDQNDSTIFYVNNLRDWNSEESKSSIRDCFVTGKWKDSEDARELLELDDLNEDDDCYGDFEDLETGKVSKGKSQEFDDDADDEAPRVIEDENEVRKRRIERKRELKQKFDAEYDTSEGGKSHYDELKKEVEHQTLVNRQEFEGMDDHLRIQYEGFRPGMYVRLEIQKVPCELITNFDPSYPLIVGGILAGEDQIGYVQIRLKKHRWHSKILKNRDPLIMSLGWRRFQTIPIYSIRDHNMRHRMIKYTPQHLHCDAHVWAPITPQGTGFLTLQSVSDVKAHFRISSTGVVLEMDKSTQVMKKLKLTGEPYKIFRKTAFIKGMFNSSLEVAKFEGAAIRSVSGIRGQIKKSLSSPEGAFRATFEDKILMSDILFVRTWYSVDIPKFYVPVTNLLLTIPEKMQWKGMKTVGQIKREKQILGAPKLDSLYTEISREPKIFNSLKIPRNLQKNLPYRFKPKSKTELKKSLDSQRIAVVLEGKEKKILDQMTRLKTLYENKQRTLASERSKRIQTLITRKTAEEEKKFKRQKEARKHVAKLLSKSETKKEKMHYKGQKGKVPS